MILSSILLTVTVAAWFIFLKKSSDPVNITSGNIDMEVLFFTGNDYNGDGILEITSGYNASLYTSLSICDNTLKYYNYQPSDKLMSFTSLTEGSTITYRCAVINRNSYKLDLSMWFYNLENYFERAVDDYLAKGQNASESYIDNYSARIMFRLESISARKYSLGVNEAQLARSSESITNISGALARMSPYSVAGAPTVINPDPNDNTRTEPIYLFSLSNEQPFIGVNDGVGNGRITLDGGSMCVIDFKMVCASKSDVNDAYTAYCNAMLESPSTPTARDAAIMHVCVNELEKVGGDVGSYSFTIPVIYVKGVQVKDEAQTVAVGETSDQSNGG